MKKFLQIHSRVSVPHHWCWTPYTINSLWVQFSDTALFTFQQDIFSHATSTKVCVSDEVAFELINHLEQICFQARIFKVESMHDKYSKVEIETLLKPQNWFLINQITSVHDKLLTFSFLLFLFPDENWLLDLQRICALRFLNNPHNHIYFNYILSLNFQLIPSNISSIVSKCKLAISN